ncbi:hypothetical protein BS47DRAFT_1324965 [Hydnum rufescens UP504]|uniref:RlpA-like protein double-psi beta-barrel domain-containing protein n=1 Tax=Hydnum rufescens UP504 TaxID=1448309 RepID=A0A9P6E1T5_9AGAM|nr:hypothetical protein BS47DRAFT_1324965 [Hydnum rufescens UP504]
MHLSTITLASMLLVISPSLLAHLPHHPNGNHNYRQYHSYPDGTYLDERDGWKRVAVSDLPYKYFNATSYSPDVFQLSKSKDIVKGAAVGGVLNEALKGIGKASQVIITWYTGKDLKNPSCWPDGKWAPTDQSFVCALTLEGWEHRPDCFSFLELCNTPKRCIYVRVVDTCAGCQVGSHHVDLTQAGFMQLAPLSVGIMNVDMRIATTPNVNTWDQDLWGPK